METPGGLGWLGCVTQAAGAESVGWDWARGSELTLLWSCVVRPRPLWCPLVLFDHLRDMMSQSVASLISDLFSEVTKPSERRGVLRAIKKEGWIENLNIWINIGDVMDSGNIWLLQEISSWGVECFKLWGTDIIQQLVPGGLWSIGQVMNNQGKQDFLFCENSCR